MTVNQLSQIPVPAKLAANQSSLCTVLASATGTWLLAYASSKMRAMVLTISSMACEVLRNLILQKLSGPIHPWSHECGVHCLDLSRCCNVFFTHLFGKSPQQNPHKTKTNWLWMCFKSGTWCKMLHPLSQLASKFLVHTAPRQIETKDHPLDSEAMPQCFELQHRYLSRLVLGE